jgi:hypothetical protein
VEQKTVAEGCCHYWIVVAVVVGTCLKLASAESAELVLGVHFERRGAEVDQVEEPELDWSHGVPE